MTEQFLVSPSRPKPPRVESVDLFRGMVMVIMALDHVRHYLSHPGSDPLDLTQTTTALFMTRWITHFCAPVFVFLAGTGAFMAGTRGKSKKELSWFLLTRGLWLVVLELTLIRIILIPDITYSFVLLGVIWAIGWSMVVLALLVHLPLGVITFIGVAMIAGHNLTDGVSPDSFGSFAWLWTILHVPGLINLGNRTEVFAMYSLIPWIGVMAIGYAFGRWLQLDQRPRRRRLLVIGFAAIAAFVVLRAGNFYGDAAHWSQQETIGWTSLSFINTTKYPPSLLFLLMTLGPAMLALVAFDRGTPRALRPILVFGRVPLFFYITHFFLIHVVALALAYLRYRDLSWWPQFDSFPADYGYSLLVIYAIWMAVVVALYVPCCWFAGVKQRHRSAWLSYL